MNMHVSQLQWHIQISYPGIYGISCIYDVFTFWWQHISTRLCATSVCAAAALAFGIFPFIWPTAVELLQLSFGPFRMDQLSVNSHTALTWARTHTFNPTAKLVWPSTIFEVDTVEPFSIKSSSLFTKWFESECDKPELCFWYNVHWAFSFFL